MCIVQLDVSASPCADIPVAHPIHARSCARAPAHDRAAGGTDTAVSQTFTARLHPPQLQRPVYAPATQERTGATGTQQPSHLPSTCLAFGITSPQRHRYTAQPPAVRSCAVHAHPGLLPHSMIWKCPAAIKLHQIRSGQVPGKLHSGNARLPRRISVF